MGATYPVSDNNMLKFSLWVFALCFCMAGIQFVYSIQFAVGLPLFAQRFKLSNSSISIILGTAGPISGFLVQPIVGVYSDNCRSRFGRRRPFILGGAIVSVIGMLLIANSIILGKLLGDNVDGALPSDHRAGMIFAIAGLWLINMAVNVMQGPGRALIADLLPPKYQNLGNAMVVNTMALSSILANVVGAQFLHSADPYRDLFYIGAAFTGFACIPTLLAAKETQYVPAPGEDIPSSPTVVFKKIGTAFVTMPNSVVRICLVFFFSWCAYTPFMIYLTTFFGVNVFHGNPNGNGGEVDPTYQTGVMWGMYTLAIFAAVSFLYSLLLPTLLRLVGTKVMYFFSQVVAGVCFIALLYCSVHHKLSLAIAIVLSSAVAINFTTFNSVPFALLAEAVEGNAGLYMGVLNSASVVSQTLTGIAAGQIVGYKGQNVAWGIGFGGILALIAGLLAFCLRVTRRAGDVEDAVERQRLINHAGEEPSK